MKTFTRLVATSAIDANLPYNFHPYILGIEIKKVGVLGIFLLFVSQTLLACEISGC